jgi:hypothetical protein
MIMVSELERSEIEKLSSSPHVLKLADSLLANLDRKTVALLISSFLYFKAKNRPDSSFTHFVMSERFPEMFWLFMRILPAVAPAVISDKEFRSALVDIALNSLTR